MDKIMRETLDTIKDCIYKSPGLGRREIMEDTDLDIRTVTSGVQRLIKQGFITASPDVNRKVGRTGMLYYPSDENNLNFYGVYLGFHEIISIVKDIKGNVLDIHHEPFSLDWASMNHTARRINKIIDNYKEKNNARISSIGLTLQERRGTDFANGVKQLLSHLSGLPVSCGSPIDAFAWSLRMQRSDVKKIAVVHFGMTKVEISFIDGNTQKIEGSKFAKELSHTTVRKNGPPCYCGKNGCLEYYVHGYAMEEEYRDIKNINPLQNVNLPERYAAGDAAAAEIVETAEKYISEAIITIFKKFKPDLLYLLVLEYDKVIKSMKNLMSGNIPSGKNIRNSFEIYNVMEKAGEACAAATADKIILFNYKK
jgi:predicted NBD/HSP70 family sugar kinase